MSDYEYEEDSVEYSDASQEFAYTDQENSDEENNPNIEKENAYYDAKGMIEQNLAEATEAFENVVRMDSSDPGEWTFKALKQLVKVHIRLGKNDAGEVIQYYQRLLQCISGGAVTNNQCEKGINGILDKVSSPIQNIGINKRSNQNLAKDVYIATLQVFRPSSDNANSSTNERLWFKTNLKLGQLLYEMNETKKLQAVIKDLLAHQHLNSATNLMEIYALQIQLYSRQKDNKKLREIFDRAMTVNGGIPHPRTLALIQEFGGKMHMASREFHAAETAFFQAFKEYGKAGDPSSIRCLKFLVMASMLHSSTINPFDSQEAKPYRDDPEIKVMTNLVQAFQNNEIQEFENILRKNEEQLMADEFVREHVEELKKTIRTQVLQSVIVPYTRISLSFIARALNGIPIEDVNNLLVSLILDEKLNGKIDQINGILEKEVDPNLFGESASGINGGGEQIKHDTKLKECLALENLATQIDRLSSTITSSIASNTGSLTY